VDSTVYDVQKWENHIYVCGAFGIVKLSQDGQLEETFESDLIKGAVYSIDVTDESLYLGGDFVLGSNDIRKNIAKIDHDGILDEAFILTDYPDGPVFSVLARNDSVWIGGAFVTVNGKSSRRVAALNSDGSSDMSFDVGTGFNNVVRELVQRDDGKIVASGAFDKLNGQSVNRIALLDANGHLVPNRYNQLNLNRTVYATDEIPGKLFAFGGTFEEQKNSPYTALGVVEALTSPLPPELFITYDIKNSLVLVVGEPLRDYDIEFSIDLENWVALAKEKSDSNGDIQFNVDVMRFKSQYFRARMREQ
jgi:hypothetical protein